MKITAVILDNICYSRLYHLMGDPSNDEGSLGYVPEARSQSETDCYDEAAFLIEIMKALRQRKKRVIINVKYEGQK